MKRVMSSTVLMAALAMVPGWIAAEQGRAGGQFPGGTNPDGSLRPSAPVTRLFTQDAYTEYALLEPGSGQFRITFLPEETRAGATELVNATRGGSLGSGIEVFDPRTGKPLPFKYEQQGDDPENHAIRATLPAPVPEGGIGRVLIYKTYKDPRTYTMNNEDIVWVRSLSGYRLGVVLPKGFAFISSNVAAQLTTTSDGRLKLAFANPSGQSNPVTIHARKTTAAFAPIPSADMFFDDVKTLYDLGSPETASVNHSSLSAEAVGSVQVRAAGSDPKRVAVEQTYSDYRKGDRARIDALGYLDLQDLKVVDLDTARPLKPFNEGGAVFVKLDVPIVDDRQSAHLKLTGTLPAPGYTVVNGELVFARTLHGLRNTILLPAGWEVAGVSQSGTIGSYRGRAFVALINLNAENSYKVTIRARLGATAPQG